MHFIVQKLEMYIVRRGGRLINARKHSPANEWGVARTACFVLQALYIAQFHGYLPFSHLINVQRAPFAVPLK